MIPLTFMFKNWSIKSSGLTLVLKREALAYFASWGDEKAII